MRRLLFVALLFAPACSLLVKTSDLSEGAALVPEGGRPEASTVAPTDAGADVADAFSYPDGAALWPVNGHAYEVVFQSHLTWVGAKVLAEGRGGHLATVANAAENAFIYGLSAGHAPADYPSVNAVWLGGKQTDRLAEPAGDWTWINGDAWAFTAWNTGEPGDDGEAGEQVLGLCNGPVWCDFAENMDYEWTSYAVEYE